MIKDPILEELERLRAMQMEEIGFDFDAFFRELKMQERALAQAPESPPGLRLLTKPGPRGR
jgi:hypothetical protein